MIFAGDLWGAVIISSDDAGLPARGRVPRRRLRRPRRAGHRQRPGARGARRLAHAHRRGQRRRAPAPGAQPPRRRPAAAGGDVAGRAPGGSPRDRRPAGCARCSTAPATSWRHALEELRELARGLHPAVLTDHGLCAAIEARRRPRAAAGQRRRAARRAPARDGRGRGLLRRLRGADQRREVRAGVAGARQRRAQRRPRRRSRSSTTASAAPTPASGSGLRGLADRVEALGGRLVVTSPAGEGTAVRAQLPVS